MRIAIDVRLLHAPRAGSATYTSALLDGLTALAPHHEFALVSGPKQEDLACADRPNASEVVLDGARLCDQRWEQLVLPAELEALSPDLFLSPTLTLPMVKPCPYALIVYDIGFETHPAFYPIELRRYLRRWTAPSCRLADRIITLSQFSAGEISAAYGVPRDRISIAPGAAAERFAPVDEAEQVRVCARYGIDGPFVLSVAGLEPNKNLHRLLQAFAAAVARADDDWRLVLVGRPGAAAADLDTLVDNLGLRDRVIITGFVPDADLPALYSAAGLFAFVSLYEGFGLPPLEAMACACPVVCSAAASLPEVVGDAARLVDPESVEDIAAALHAVMSYPSLRERLASAALEQAARFSWEETAAVVLEALEGIIHRRQRSQEVTIS